MGEARNRKQRLLASHPNCCFCGGNVAATTIDHVPSRACFPERIGPDGFEFPACSDCQTAFRQEEHFFAFFVRMSDRDEGNYDKETSTRLIKGISNNLPQLLPDLRLGSSEKRRALRDFGLEKPSHISLEEIKMAAFPIEIDPVIRQVAIKLALALFYKHKHKPAGKNYWVASYWTQTADQKTITKWVTLLDDLTQVEIGTRPNANLGNRFRYRWAVEEPGHTDIFASIVQFGEGLVLFLMVVEEQFWNSDDPATEFVKVRDWQSRNFEDDWLRLTPSGRTD